MQTFQQLMTETLAEAGFSDEQVTIALNKVYANEKLSPKLNSLVKTATEDYQAQVGRVKQYQDWYPKAKEEYDRMAQEYARVNQEIEALRNGGGNQQPVFDETKYVSKADLLAMRVDMARSLAPLLKDTARISARHAVRFKEEPDMDAIDRIATEQNLPINAAYDRWIEPRVKEQEKQANEDWKKQQREEIERDIRSRYKLPVEHVSQDTSPMFRSKSAETPKDMDSELMAAWNSTPSKP